MIQVEIDTKRQIKIHSISYELKVSDELVFIGESPEAIIEASLNYKDLQIEPEPEGSNNVDDPDPIMSDENLKKKFKCNFCPSTFTKLKGL